MHEINQRWDIILASASPRRAELLRGMGIEFETFPLHCDETEPEGLTPTQIAQFLAGHKADHFPDGLFKEKTLVITADTLVVKDEVILGKPKHRDEAVKTLNILSGSRHEVITAIHLRSLRRRKTFTVSTSVWFRELSDEEISFYIDQFQPYDKAGSYGIQEWIGYVGICRIEGSYFNVVGLPTSRLYEELARF